MKTIDDGPFKRVGTNCKFCKKPISLEIAISYDEISDPHKLLPMAACNECADIRVERRSIESKIKFTCSMMQRLGKKYSDEKMAKTKIALEGLLKQYASMISRFHFMSGMAWDDECLEAIMEHPENWNEVLSRLWKMFRDSNPERA